MSPRPVVRVADVDAYGKTVNTYTGHRSTTSTEPDRPWAVYLAGPDRRFRLLCFDLDAKTAGTATGAVRDADVLTGLMGDVGLDVVVCQSGPGGGRHVWTALADGADAQTVATVARLARHLCPTLDISPMTNPATGCVRPPGSPHRDGGRSTVLAGDLSTLARPTGTPAQVRSLAERLALLVGAEPPSADPRCPIPLDEHARLYLPGPRRSLPAPSAAALDEDAACGDASSILWRILVGAAAARWRHADVAALVARPGMEHVRTYRDRAARRPRTRTDADQLLRRQWDKAVRYVATTARRTGDDPTFDTRADQITSHVHDVQTRADATAGRWAHRGGPADRRVLDALCLLALQAMTTTVEADTRRLALNAGIGRETARTALARLAADGWLSQARPAEGPHGAAWKIEPAPAIHSDLDQDRSQADPRPEGAGAARRAALTTTLTQRLTLAAHDLFTHPGTPGLHTGNLYARTTTDPQTVESLARQTGTSPASTLAALERLRSVGVLTCTGDRWKRYTKDRCAAAAARLGVDGRLARRAARYAVERELWAWWQAEDTWMRAPHRPGTKRRPGRGQLSLVPDDGTHAYGPHPRRADGTLDWRAARQVVEHERHGQAARPHRRQGAPAAVQQAAESLVRAVLGGRKVA